LNLLNSLQEALIRYKYKSNQFSVQVQTKEFPIKGNTAILLIVTSVIYPMYFSLSMINLFLPYITSLVTEKKEKIKSGLQMMGCSMIAYNMSWYIVTFMESIIAVLLMTIMIYVLRIFHYTSFSLFAVILFLYSLSFIPMANICSLFFNEPKYASMFGNIVFVAIIFMWIIVRFIFFNFFITSLWVKLIFNLFAPFAFCEFMLQLSAMENSKSYFGWSNLGSLGTYSTADNVLCLFIDCILYTILSFYLEKVIPNENGTATSPFFFLKPSFWKGLIPKRSLTNYERNRENYGVLEEEIEEDNIELMNENDIENPSQPGIVIKHLTKKYAIPGKIFVKEYSVVVDDLSLNINSGEIFALLGANGAGKTTTIRMLTGLTPPTSGTAYINNLSIHDDIDSIRQLLGICLQENLVFDKLTVAEHLRIFGVIKNVQFSLLENEINHRLEQVDLLEEKTKKASDLSGGMKRRMCIAIALIGDPKVIILDEPTTGLDPLSRRKIWELLQGTKRNKTIILTTHSMEEADILGDGGIAILKKGKLEVVGNSLFLKNHYGAGYNLQLTIRENCDQDAVKNFIGQYIEDCEFKSHTSSQMVFMLPYQSVSKFPAFLKALETSLEDLCIENYGLTQTTLEQVFLKINEDLLQ